MRLLLFTVVLVPLLAMAQEREIQQALIQRDRQAAEFARPELRDLHLRQDMQQGPVRPDERVMQARERDAYPVQRSPSRDEAPVYARPLPLPGGPRPLVDPIPVQGLGG
jgi:hypothetical protein